MSCVILVIAIRVLGSLLNLVLGCYFLIFFGMEQSYIKTQERYNNPRLCLVNSISSIQVEDCSVDLYNLSLYSLSQDSLEEAGGVFYYSYNNFLSDRCDGIKRPRQNWANITCWQSSHASDRRLRISPVFDTPVLFLLVGIGALVVGMLSALYVILSVKILLEDRVRVFLWAAQGEDGEDAQELEAAPRQPEPVAEWVGSVPVTVGAPGWKEQCTATPCPFVRQSLEALEGDWTAIDCPVCYSTLADKAEAAWWPCGHVVCAECAVSVFSTDFRVDSEIADGYRCPQCRARSALSSIRRLQRDPEVGFS